MTYRIMLLVELTKLSDMSDNFVVTKEYNERQIGKYASAGEDKLWLRKSH